MSTFQGWQTAKVNVAAGAVRLNHRAGKQVTADGKLIAKAKMPAVTEGLADRLNEEDYREEQDKWSA
ncbi:hypothetical protein [Bradyrhizobium japonicum]|uniref:hypothetical protein n=1 Tax=Bradyrhizobium japonicum TaxID=375 RepID=UPI003B66D912